MSRCISYFAGAASLIALAGAARAADPQLTIFDWAGWEIDGALKPYVEKHGQKPTYSFYADDDEAFQKVASGFKADVVHPCPGAVPNYREAGLIEPWDTSKVEAFANIDPHLFASHHIKDEGGVWFLPYDFAYTAIAYNKTEVPEEDVGSLDVFLNPKYAGRIAISDNSDDVWALGFLATGTTSWDEVTDEQITAAADWLRQAAPQVRSWWSDPSELAQMMASGEVLVSWSWNDPVAILQAEGFPVGFNRAPKEGSTSFFCGFVNIKDGPGNEDKVYDWVNSMYAVESLPSIIEAIGYANTNKAATDAVSPEVLKGAFLDPIDSTVFLQTPMDPDLRARLLEEFELIKMGM
ncbi:ABC transporter substrate-binding protein [Pseudogemmobacter faecipullorum]|uniref:Extracellular solute-binding protein n=1 Tax=Pseudogemmobacter faecipullorum TaxID=2755041 RepID=A0ABS8CLH5_9RHOB|nr:extracellular solute-binding protein [Pseudogemmobacter faecipullorum]MCB5410251.1 extracellular solute-binding protein [Pseudogemmobacter faecipullorum]